MPCKLVLSGIVYIAVRSKQKGLSYRLTDVMVKSYKLSKYLSMPKSEATIITIPDIGEVKSEPEPDPVVTMEHKLWLLAVLSLEMYSTCIICKNKISTDDDCGLAECSKCKMFLALTHCKNETSGKLMFYSKEDDVTMILTIFQENLTKITEDQPITPPTLLKAPPFSIAYKD